MRRTLVCSLAGAGVGFLVGFLPVRLLAGFQGAGDATAVAVFIGVFLAGSGGIAGAVIGGVTELLKVYRAKDDREKDARTQSGSDFRR